MRRSSAVLLAGATWLSAAELTLSGDPLVRAGVPLRVQVDGDAEVLATADPLVLSAVLERNGRDLATAAVDLTGGAALRGGVVLVLVPAATAVPMSASANPPRVHVLLARRDGSPVALRKRDLAAPDQLRARLGSDSARDPATLLRQEQAALLLARDPVPLSHWLRAQRILDPAARDDQLPVRDPIDGSLQPLRLHRPPGAVSRVVLVLARPDGPEGEVTKAEWPALPTAWVDAADAAGVVIAQGYPAGDATWTGIGLRRVPAMLRALAGLVPDAQPIIVLGVGPAVPGAAAGAARGGPAQGFLAVEDPARMADPATWRLPATIANPPASLPGRLANYADGPFVLVVGTGEHAAAAADNRHLAERFRAAWRDHAHGEPPQVDDTAFDRARWADHHWVLVGNPRSNALAAECFAGVPLPIVWDAREVRLGTAVCHRSLLPAIALGLADPHRPGRYLLLIDGTPAWSGGLPFLSESRSADALLIPPGQEPVRLLLAPRGQRP